MLNLRIATFLSLSTMIGACADGPAEKPGSLSNPKLAELANIGLKEQVRLMNPVRAPGLIPQAAANANLWLTEIDEVVAHCKYGPRNNSKSNLLVYEVTLNTGEVIKDVSSGQRCFYEVAKPLVMRVRFKAGIVNEVLTDGRELTSPVAAARGEMNQFAESVVRVDWRRNAQRYFTAKKSDSEISDEWRARKQ
jgi:hypothetical protein